MRAVSSAWPPCWITRAAGGEPAPAIRGMDLAAATWCTGSCPICRSRATSSHGHSPIASRAIHVRRAGSWRSWRSTCTWARTRATSSGRSSGDWPHSMPARLVAASRAISPSRPSKARSLAGLHLGPQPVGEAQGLLVLGGDRIEPLHHLGIGIDRAVLEDRLVEELLARQVAVGVAHMGAVAGRDVGALQVVDEGMRLVGVFGVLRDGEIVEEHLRAFLRDGVADLAPALDLLA